MARQLFAGLVAASLGLLSASSTLASETFPEALSDALAMECPPPCTICHDRPTGGRGTVKKRFGLAMDFQGDLVQLAPDLIPSALELIQGDMCARSNEQLENGTGEPGPCDSDSDGVSDVDELRRNRDPNVAGVNDEIECGPTYGCGARIEPRGDTDYWAILAGAMTALVLGISARRRNRKS